MLSTIFSGWDDLIVVVVAVVVLFGGTQLPKLARNAGEAMKEFRKGHSETGAQDPPAASAQASPTELPREVSQPAQTTSASVAEEPITLTRGQLDAILADTEARAKAPQSGGADAQV
ncbi:MAG: twin-arginine translocase TatA/TatE family subunit [Acidimicrobiales bacterium]